MKKNITAERVYELRHALMFTQLEFAHHLGISTQHVSMWETGIKIPNMKSCAKIIKLARKYGLDITYEDLIPV